MGPKAEARADATAQQVRPLEGSAVVVLRSSQRGYQFMLTSDVGALCLCSESSTCLTKTIAVQMKADAKATPAEKAGTSMSLKARADVMEQGFFDEKAEWNYARNVEVRWPAKRCCLPLLWG